jgi:5-(carboxyamino)imidazole ribonucleotide synthase
LTPDGQAPAAQVSQYALQYAYDDPVGIERLSGLVSRVTTEFENVPAQTLEQLSERVLVRPSAYAVSVAQDRIVEKNMVRSCQLQTAPFHVIRNPEDASNTPQSFSQAF